MSAHTLLAVPIISADRPLPEQVRMARAAGADLVELRVDCINDLPAVRRLLDQPHELPMILTVRSPDQGGRWTGDEAGRIGLILQLAQSRPEYVDLEYAAWRRSAEVRRKIATVCQLCGPRGDRGLERAAGCSKNRLILSHHDLIRTPTDLESLFQELLASPAPVVKLACTAADATDACRLMLHLRRQAAARDLIALSMGEAGLATRVLAGKFGAFLTFASLEAGQESAPGQPTLAQLHEQYRWRRIGPPTGVYGVVGWPVTHSQSPAFHNAALEAAGIDAIYLPLPVQPGYDSLSAFLDLVSSQADLGFRGLSVTTPHKENALRWLETRGLPVGSLARQCAAVNTLTRRPDGTWEGDNTDVHGVDLVLRKALQLAGSDPRQLRVDLLGAGGVARAAIVALRSFGCQICIYNRSEERAARLAQEMRCQWRPWAQRLHYAGNVLINCTPVGMWPACDQSPLPPDALRPDTLVFDTVYNPPQTALLTAAAQRGCRTIGGKAMFIGQARRQFEIWHGRPPAPEAFISTGPDSGRPGPEKTCVAIWRAADTAPIPYLG